MGKNLYFLLPLAISFMTSEDSGAVENVTFWVLLAQIAEVTTLFWFQGDKYRFIMAERIFLVVQDFPQVMWVIWFFATSRDAKSQFQVYAVISSLLFLVQETVRTCIEARRTAGLTYTMLPK